VHCTRVAALRSKRARCGGELFIVIKACAEIRKVAVRLRHYSLAPAGNAKGFGSGIPKRNRARPYGDGSLFRVSRAQNPSEVLAIVRT
jgi:hypothetical protein